MKRLALVMCLSAVACSDDSTAPAESRTIAGTYVAQSFEYVEAYPAASDTSRMRPGIDTMYFALRADGTIEGFARIYGKHGLIISDGPLSGWYGQQPDGRILITLRDQYSAAGWANFAEWTFARDTIRFSSDGYHGNVRGVAVRAR